MMRHYGWIPKRLTCITKLRKSSKAPPPAVAALTVVEINARRQQEDEEQARCEAEAREHGRRGWLPRDAVPTTFHKQMELDLAFEGLERPFYGTLEKNLCEGEFDMECERYSFWSKVRACSEYLASPRTRTAIASLEAEREAKIAAVHALPVNAVHRTRLVKNATKDCAAKVEALMPEPMRVRAFHWKELCYYPELVGDEDEACEFVDPQATIDECALAIASGMHVLCSKYPSLCCASAALTTAWVRYLTQDQTLRNKTPTERQARLQGKAVSSAALVRHLEQNKTDAARFPPASVAVVVGALDSPVGTGPLAHKRYTVFALRLLAVLPVALVSPHAAAIGDRVSAVVDKQLVNLYEVLIKRLYDPKFMDMQEEKAKAMALYE